MARLDPRCSVQLPLTLIHRHSEKAQEHEAVLANIGLGGAFIRSEVPIAASSSLKMQTCLKDDLLLELDVEVLRQQDDGLAVKFLNMEPHAKHGIWEFIRENVSRDTFCPYCGRETAQGYTCSHCGFSTDFTIQEYLDIHDGELKTYWLEILDRAGDRFNERLLDIEKRFAKDPSRELELAGEVNEAMLEVLPVISEVEATVGPDREILSAHKKRLRQKTDTLCRQSYFWNHARTWPKGYPGDYSLLENIYRNLPLSEGVGKILDRTFLESELARGVRYRLAAVRDILKKELARRRQPRIFNIACGSSRELLELALDITASDAGITCLDYDNDALRFSITRLLDVGVGDRVRPVRYNALRLVNAERVGRDFGTQDVIYSMGLFDYLTDDVLIKSFRSLWMLLSPGGSFIITFKDCRRYTHQLYHWFVDWDGFHQRTEEDSRRIIRLAGIPDEAVIMERDPQGAILIYTAVKEA